MVTISPVHFISSPGNFTKYAFTTYFITEWFGAWLIFFYCVWVFVAFSFFFCLVRCNILWNKNEQLERKCGCAASFPLPTGVGAVITNCLESQQCLSSSNISDVTYPSVSELQSKAELYKLALNETACVPTAMYLTSPRFFLHYFK